MRIKAKRMILIIVVCIVVYLVAGAIGPFIKYKDVSSQTAEEFRADSFRSSEAGTDRPCFWKQVKAPWNTAYG